MKTEKTSAVLWRILKILILVIVGIVLLANLYRLAAREIFKVKDPTVFGYSSAVVLTGSMSGAIEPDDFIITHKQSDYTVGDIVMYQTGGTPVTHRIISENEKGYRTKGDANNTEDASPVQWGNTVGRVKFGIPFLGKPMRVLTAEQNRPYVIAAIILLFISSVVWDIVSRKGRKKHQSAHAKKVHSEMPPEE